MDVGVRHSVCELCKTEVVDEEQFCVLKGVCIRCESIQALQAEGEAGRNVEGPSDVSG